LARTDPPWTGDERTMLLAWLDFHRETMVSKLDGLDEQQARWTPTETSNSLLSLVRHLMYVEEWWYHECFLGLPELLPWEQTPDSDDDFIVGDDETISEIVGWYRRQWTRSNEIARAAPSLDEGCAHPEGEARGVTLRWILVHMVEETARHAGHADITRELLDGTVEDS
jgi:uncharacterized damage-inducible protein DinB